MIIYKKGNLFASKCQVLVNTVNCIGVMGKGIAKQFRERWPEMFDEYKHWCKTKADIGKLMWWFEPTNMFNSSTHIICNFPTKKEWYYSSKLEYIEEGLKTFVDEANVLHIKSAAFPKLGCNNGKLNWEDVKPLMEKYLNDLDIVIEIYE